MPRLSQAEIRNNAVAFVHEWKDETRERAEAQTFWNEFLQVFGVKRRQVAVFEKAVQKNNQNTGAIDLFWRGVLLVEHKSRGQNLDKASSQAYEYLENLNEDELPELVLLSDFERFRLFNLETSEETDFTLARLPDLIHLFGAISGYQKREYKEQDPVNLKVAVKLGELHDALFRSGYTGHKLEAFLVRLVYCLFADDTGIFLPRSSFLFFLQEKTAEDGSNLGAMLAQLFQVLDTPEADRQICGRLESRYRYSKDIVYNNFPWPAELSDGQKYRIEQTAQGILGARAKFPGATLADLYDPLTMPKQLLDAHRSNDEAVDSAYGKRRFRNELERLEFLFDLYRQYTEPLRAIEEKQKRKTRRTR